MNYLFIYLFLLLEEVRSNPSDQNVFALVLPGHADAMGHPKRARLCAAGRVSLVSRSMGPAAALAEDLLLKQHLCCSLLTSAAHFQAVCLALPRSSRPCTAQEWGCGVLPGGHSSCEGGRRNRGCVGPAGMDPAGLRASCKSCFLS